MISTGRFLVILVVFFSGIFAADQFLGGKAGTQEPLLFIKRKVPEVIESAGESLGVRTPFTQKNNIAEKVAGIPEQSKTPAYQSTQTPSQPASQTETENATLPAKDDTQPPPIEEVPQMQLPPGSQELNQPALNTATNAKGGGVYDANYYATPAQTSIIQDWRTCYPGKDTTWSPTTACPNYPNGWTPQNVVTIMKNYPAYFFDLGVWNQRSPGSNELFAMGKHINALQDLLRSNNMDQGKILLHFRNDVYKKSVPGFNRCATSSCPWEGDMDGSKGEPSFNTDWVLRVPTAVHNQVVKDFWAGQDPFREENAHTWAPSIDREAIIALNTATEKVALYTGGDGPTEDSFAIAGVVMDIRNPEYRKWSAKHLLYIIEDMGITPGEPITLAYAYKAAWHTYYDGPPNTCCHAACYVPALSDGTPVHMWMGPAHICSNGEKMYGPMHPTPFGPGEFEAGVNAYLKLVTEELLAAGYEKFNLLTIEANQMPQGRWAILSSETRHNPHLIGVWGGQSFVTPDVNTLPQTGLVLNANQTITYRSASNLFLSIIRLALFATIFIFTLQLRNKNQII